MPQAQNVKVISPTGVTTYFNGDVSGIAALGNSQVYNVPIAGGGFYSGVASGYGQGGGAPAVNSNPTPTPYQSPDGAVSSGDVVTGAGMAGATTAAGNALTGGNNAPTPAPWQQTLLSQMQTSHEASAALAAKQMESNNASYDALLAQTNSQYADLFNQLANSHMNEVQAGTARAVALNPYSQSLQASTAAGYTQTLDAKYQTQKNLLTSKMQAAQSLIQSNKIEQGNKLMKEAQDEATTFLQNQYKIMQDADTAATAQASADRAQANADRTFGFNVMEKGAADFNTLLTQLSGSPTIQANIEAFQNDGTLTPDLQLIIAKGQQAGYSPEASVAIFSMQSQAVRKAQADENYRAQLLANQNARTDIAQANYYNRLSSQIPMPGQIVSAANDTPVKLTDSQSLFFSMGQHLDTQATKVQKLIDGLPTNAIKGWVTEQGKFVPVVQNKNDPKQYELLQQMADLNNMFIYFSTGKQLNETEFNRLSNQLPNIKATPEFNKTALTNFVASINERMDSYLAVNGWKIYGASNKAPEAPSTGGSTYQGFTLPF